MKRGLITWDRDELAPEVFEARVDNVRERARARSVPAIAIYTDVWRSNEARFVANFMPYFNRSLLAARAYRQEVKARMVGETCGAG